MRLLSTAIVATALLLALLPATGICEVSDEIVILGGENEKPPTNAAQYQPDMTDIKLDGVIFFRIRTGAIGYTVAERESIVLKRLVEIMSSGVISPVHVNEVRGKATVYVDKIRLITVYPEDVIAAGAPNANAVAESWAEGVRNGLLATAPSNCFGGPPVYTVAIGGTVFFKLADSYVYPNVRRRGEEADRRLARVVDGFDAKLVETVPVRGGVSVLYDGMSLVTATPADAQAKGAKSADALAEGWAKRLRTMMPSVSVGAAACGSGACGGCAMGKPCAKCAAKAAGPKCAKCAAGEKCEKCAAMAAAAGPKCAGCATE